MAATLEPHPPAATDAHRQDPGDTLIDLLNFAEQITPFTPARPPETLAFPSLARLAEATRQRETER